MTHKYCKIMTANKPTRGRTPAEIDACIEQLARDAVSGMIERGLATYDMDGVRLGLIETFGNSEESSQPCTITWLVMVAGMPDAVGITGPDHRRYAFWRPW